MTRTVFRIRLVKHLANVYKEFNKKYDLHDSQAYLSAALLSRAIDNALIDIERMSTWHIPENSTPDAHKYAGFVAKWIAKERPIQLRKESPVSQVNEKLHWANAIFAVYVMSSFLSNNGVPSSLAINLKYWFAFREEKGEVLALVAYCCEHMTY